MRTILHLAAALLMLSPVAALAQSYDSPKALLGAAYASYETDEFPEDPMALYSENLKALFAADEARTAEGEIGAVDFDPFINAQDYEISDVVIGEPQPLGDEGAVTSEVSFKNSDRAERMIFTLVEEDDGWKIEDIEHPVVGETEGWRLSEILAEDPMLN